MSSFQDMSTATICYSARHTLVLHCSCGPAGRVPWCCRWPAGDPFPKGKSLHSEHLVVKVCVVHANVCDYRSCSCWFRAVWVDTSFFQMGQPACVFQLKHIFTGSIQLGVCLQQVFDIYYRAEKNLQICYERESSSSQLSIPHPTPVGFLFILFSGISGIPFFESETEIKSPHNIDSLP